MRSLVALVLLTSAVAWACPPTPDPPPPRAELALLTPADATIPGDGAIMVSRTYVSRSRFDTKSEDARWTVKDGAGHEVALTVEVLGGGVERWQPTRPADRDLVIVDANGKTIARLKETKAEGSTKPPAPPRVKSLTSNVPPVTTASAYPAGPGETSTLVLRDEPPANAKWLLVSVLGASGYNHSLTAMPPAQRELTWTAWFPSADYLRKPCAYPRGAVGPPPVAIGQRIGLTYIDDLGRRSVMTKVVVAKTSP